MQLVDANLDSKLYIANLPTLRVGGRCTGAGQHGGLLSLFKGTTAAERLLALLLMGPVVAASPALLNTIRSVVSVTLQILLEAGHAGMIAFQIFGR